MLVSIAAGPLNVHIFRAALVQTHHLRARAQQEHSRFLFFGQATILGPSYLTIRRRVTADVSVWVVFWKMSASKPCWGRAQARCQCLGLGISHFPEDYKVASSFLLEGILNQEVVQPVTPASNETKHAHRGCLTILPLLATSINISASRTARRRQPDNALRRTAPTRLLSG